MTYAALGALVGLVLGLLERVLLLRLAPAASDGTTEGPAGSSRLWWVPVAVAALAAAVYARAAIPAVTVTLILSGVWLCALVAVDLAVRRLPDVLTLPALPVVLALLACCSWAVDDWGRWGTAVLCGAGYGLTFLVLAVINPAGLGMGDVKLAVPLGMLTGWWGWAPTVLAFLVTFVVATVWGLCAAALRRGGPKTSFPLGPSMALGSFLVLLAYA